MKKYSWYIFPFVVALGASILHAQTQNAPEVPIAGTQLLHINSTIVNQLYDIYVSLPRNYDDTTQAFPVIYVNDAQWDFTLVTALYGQQYFDGFIPGCIVVGVTWGGPHPNPDSLRVRDYTPTHTDQAPQSGGAEQYIKFLKTELIPFIDQKYRTKKDDRTMVGSSLGGLITLYTLFTANDTFNRFILTSPAIDWANKSIDRYQKDFVAHHPERVLRVYLAEGGLEPGAKAFTDYVEQLKKAEVPLVSIDSKVIDDVGHSGGKADGYTRGLQFVFARPSISVPATVLDTYTGTYKYGISVDRDETGLFINLPNGLRMKLLAETDKDFYIKGQYSFWHFIHDQKGGISGIRIEQFTGTQFLPKSQ